MSMGYSTEFEQVLHSAMEHFALTGKDTINDLIAAVVYEDRQYWSEMTLIETEVLETMGGRIAKPSGRSLYEITKEACNEVGYDHRVSELISMRWSLDEALNAAI